MPVKRRKSKARYELNEAEASWLRGDAEIVEVPFSTGFDMPDCKKPCTPRCAKPGRAGCGSLEWAEDHRRGMGRPTLRDLWNLHRDSVFPQWIERNPGTRPRAWWCFDAPAARRKDESERQYLERHKLLVEGE